MLAEILDSMVELKKEMKKEKLQHKLIENRKFLISSKLFTPFNSRVDVDLGNDWCQQAIFAPFKEKEISLTAKSFVIKHSSDTTFKNLGWKLFGRTLRYECLLPLNSLANDFHPLIIVLCAISGFLCTTLPVALLFTIVLCKRSWMVETNLSASLKAFTRRWALNQMNVPLQLGELFRLNARNNTFFSLRQKAKLRKCLITNVGRRFYSQTK